MNLNYDIVQAEHINIDEQQRKELFELALEIVQEAFYKEIMANLSKLEDPNRNKNFYNGYTKIKYPINTPNYDNYGDLNLYFDVSTSASSGNISTKNFAKKFDVEKLDGMLFISVLIYTPSDNITFDFNIEGITIKEFSDKDKFTFMCDPYGFIDDDSCVHFDADITNINKTVFPVMDRRFGKYRFEIYLLRTLSQEDIKAMETLDKMPGFRVTWKSSSDVENWPKFINDDATKWFVR